MASIVQRLSTLGQQVLHGGRVLGHVAKEVAAKEQFGPPSLGELGQAQLELQQAIKNTRSFKFMDYTVGQVIQKATAAFSVVSFFIVGEIVGRRSLIGYRY